MPSPQMAPENVSGSSEADGGGTAFWCAGKSGGGEAAVELESDVGKGSSPCGRGCGMRADKA